MTPDAFVMMTEVQVAVERMVTDPSWATVQSILLGEMGWLPLALGWLAVLFAVHTAGSLLLTLGHVVAGNGSEAVPQPQTYPPLPDDAFDVCVVGAGPAGSVTAYYAVKAGLRVLLLEKKKFPRVKVCGDAVCTQAQDIMEDMESATGHGSVLDEIMREGLGHAAANGGLVSPAGYSYIGNSVGDAAAGKLSRSAVIAIKRVVMDEKLARSAAHAGALLVEEASVEAAHLDTAQRLWQVRTECGDAGEPMTYKARVLVCADGAPSRLAMQLGIVKEAPQGTCSRQPQGTQRGPQPHAPRPHQRRLLPVAGAGTQTRYGVDEGGLVAAGRGGKVFRRAAADRGRRCRLYRPADRRRHPPRHALGRAGGGGVAGCVSASRPECALPGELSAAVDARVRQRLSREHAPGARAVPFPDSARCGHAVHREAGR
eukprot:ctg_378.g140